MSKFFYSKLAASNIKKNRKTYLPYMLTCMFTIALYYIMSSLSMNEGIRTMIGSETVAMTLSLACWVVILFSAIFLFYTNSFLMKRRKREFGLFNILGMEKKHISKVIFMETLYMYVISSVFGIALGIGLDKAMYLLLLKILGYKSSLGFYVSGKSALNTLIMFGVIFLLILANSVRQIHLAEPIALLKSASAGEREPKTRWFMAAVGMVCLGAGYYISITSKNPIEAILLFFVAVILVIVGTYLLFSAGSIALLKQLRKNKNYYYKTRHFTSVSGMIYRMKQNAVGLANICILSTIVLVMVSSTSSMMIGIEDIIKTRYPYDLTITSKDYSQEYREHTMDQVEKIMKAQGLDFTAKMSYMYLSFGAVQEGNTFNTDRNDNTAVNLDNLYNLFFITLDEYNRTTGEQQTLEDGEVLIYSNRDPFGDYADMKLFDETYKIKGKLDHFVGNGMLAANIAGSHFIVVKDMDVLHNLDAKQKAVYGENASDVKVELGFDMTGEDEAKIQVYEQLKEQLGGSDNYVESKAASAQGFIGLYGGFFYIGIFLGLLFVVATILIIYYKQISEGYDDKERFVIMQKVGMSHEEIKRSIHSQILTVFFLPLVTAGIHVIFAFPMVSRILELLNLTNTSLYIGCTAVCFVIFAVMYGIIYATTARTYYRIVSWENET
ncbi:MAG: ABC transporter permease [Lachnospiraceae bacterium]|nr:ABC transporter permease [Lachnospiraceae bacterium]